MLSVEKQTQRATSETDQVQTAHVSVFCFPPARGRNEEQVKHENNNQEAVNL